MMRLSTVAAAVNGALVGKDLTFDTVCTDSRTLERGALFVALCGPRFDGHDYCAEACARGAVALLVHRPVAIEVPQIVVAETKSALARLAAAWRVRHEIAVVAITGSNGKTTIKEMVAAILRTQGEVAATHGNLNNEIGLPLTVLRMGAETRFAVLEMGANQPGEIGRLAAVARPSVAVISNVAPAHLAGFGSLEGVARAKGEILQGLASDGVAVLNADEPFLGLWQGLVAPRRIVTFGLRGAADVSVTKNDGQVAACQAPRSRGTCFALRAFGQVRRIELPLLGRHNVANALAAAAAVLALDIGLDAVADGLRGLAPVAGRLQLRCERAGVHIVDDSYNANPGSFEAAFEAVRTLGGEAWLVLGDMGELGDDAEIYHEQLGARARAHGIARLFAVGELSRAAVRRFGAGATHFGDQDALLRSLLPQLHAGLTVLIKGSRLQRMERVAGALCADMEA